MSKFAQYYIKYHHEFAPYDWEEREKYFGSLFEKDNNIEFTTLKDEKNKVCKHRVYHLGNNPNIIVMQFANSIDIPIEKNYEPDIAHDEPSCFVIIDNREGQRAIAIQNRKKAFPSPGRVASIIADNINRILLKEKLYSLEILPDYYPEDLFKAWERLQRNTQAMRFGVPELTAEEIQQKVEYLKEEGKEYFDDSLLQPMIQMALEAKKAKYKQFYTVMPEDKKNSLYLDKSTVFMKNLITFSKAAGMPIELVTSDAGTFRCYVETDEENRDKIVSRDFDAKLLEQLFHKKNSKKEALSMDEINKIEGEIVELLNRMPHLAEDDNGEYVA